MRFAGDVFTLSGPNGLPAHAEENSICLSKQIQGRPSNTARVFLRGLDSAPELPRWNFKARAPWRDLTKFHLPKLMKMP